MILEFFAFTLHRYKVSEHVQEADTGTSVFFISAFCCSALTGNG